MLLRNAKIIGGLGDPSSSAGEGDAIIIKADPSKDPSSSTSLPSSSSSSPSPPPPLLPPFEHESPSSSSSSPPSSSSLPAPQQQSIPMPPPPVPLPPYIQSQLSPQAIQEWREYILHHNMHPYMMDLSNAFTAHVIAPPLAATLAQQMQIASSPDDYSFDDFLDAEGINIPYFTAETDKMDDFSKEVYRLVTLYNNTSTYLAHQCLTSTVTMINTLKEQSKTRCVSQEEINTKIKVIHHKFESMRIIMKATVCEGIKTTEGRFGYRPKPKKRCFPRKVNRLLNNWFFEHITDPYPTEAEKQAFSEQCGITLTQVCNWFANKRIRHMRASKEAELKAN